MSRFGLELVVFMIAAAGVVTNLALENRAYLLESSDQSTVFSYLKNNPSLNNPLTNNQTTTILARTDQWVTSRFASALAHANLVSSSTEKNTTSDTTIQENVIVKTNPADTDNFLRNGKTVYEVESGDNLISIASSFGISPQTIMMENNLDESAVLRPGQKLSILPTTGISHKVAGGETIESIASKYKVSEDDILDVNDIELPDDIIAGDVLVVPLPQVNMPAKPKPASKFVKDESNKIALKTAVPSSFSAGALSFIWPTTTRQITQGFHRRHSGLDISNSSMVAIYAAEEGFVELSGWQSGYGNTVIINHGNGYKTRYGHASELYVSAGEHVAKGQTIAKQGRTGRVRGVTGIHLHFEIMKNGAKVNPLSYVKP